MQIWMCVLLAQMVAKVDNCTRIVRRLSEKEIWTMLHTFQSFSVLSNHLGLLNVGGVVLLKAHFRPKR